MYLGYMPMQKNKPINQNETCLLYAMLAPFKAFSPLQAFMNMNKGVKKWQAAKV